MSLGAIRDPGGKARIIFGELEDLTAQYLASSELDRQRNRLEMAIEASGMSVWELDVVSGLLTVQARSPGEAEFHEQNMTYGHFVRTFYPDDRGLLPTIRAIRSHGLRGAGRGAARRAAARRCAMGAPEGPGCRATTKAGSCASWGPRPTSPSHVPSAPNWQLSATASSWRWKRPG